MSVTYSLNNSVMVLDNGKLILTYGIVARDAYNGEVLAHFDDISVSKSLTQRIADILNRCEVDISHFHEVVIDELGK